MMQLFIDNDYDIKDYFGYAVQWSMTGPFGFYWVGIFQSINAAQGSASGFGNIWYWVFLILHIAYAFFSAYFQLIMVPKVLDFAESNETLDELIEDSETIIADAAEESNENELFADF